MWQEHNFRIHLLAAIIVIFLGFYFKVTRQEWLWLVAAIGLVFITETINTAIEKLVDLTKPERDPLAGQIKDVAAGAVLISAITALIIGIVTLWPYFCSIFG